MASFDSFLPSCFSPLCLFLSKILQTFDISTLDVGMENIESVILFLIEQTTKKAKRYSQREFEQRKLGITIEQWVLLKIVDEHEGLSQNDLAQKSYRDRASITRSLDILEKKGLLERIPIKGNRRQYEIHLSEQGKVFVTDNMDMILRHRTKSLEGFSPEEVKSLRSMLLRIQDNMT